MKIAVVSLIAAVICGLLSIIVTAYTLHTNQLMKPLVSASSRFYCAQQPDALRGGNVLTVMYRHDSGIKPWLKMVETLGGGWSPQARCEEIARRLDIFRLDGLIALEYRTDPNTPGQYVICGKTKSSGKGCPLVLTLKPKDQPYEALREVAGALLVNNPATYQGSRKVPSSSLFATAPLVINVENHLSAEDRSAEDVVPN